MFCSKHKSNLGELLRRPGNDKKLRKLFEDVVTIGFGPTF